MAARRTDTEQGMTEKSEPTDPFLSHLHEQVGGIPEVLGPWQLELMLHLGLEERSTLVDVGCGTLRGGLHLIRHLAPGHYVGVDPLARLVEEGQQLLAAAGLEEKRPRLGPLDLLDRLPSGWADFVLTQSVLNHLNAEQIEATVARVSRLIAPTGVWVSTGKLSDDVDGVAPGKPHPTRPNELWDSVMETKWLRELLSRHRLALQPVRGQEHPRGLDVFSIRRTAST